METTPPSGTVLVFDSRLRGSERLVVVVAGDDAPLWPVTVLRMKDLLPKLTDVCLVSVGGIETQLRGAAAAMEWSFLALAESSDALALDAAIERHPDARWVHRLSDDIVIGQQYCESLEETFEHALRADVCEVGVVIPTLNVDGFSYRSFLSLRGRTLVDEFRFRFGDCRISAANAAVCRDVRAAEFLWELSRPFDPLVAQFLKRPLGFELSPLPTGGGAMLFQRALWREMGGFASAASENADADTNLFSRFCFEHGRMIVLSHRTFAGHVGYAPQRIAMIAWITARKLNAAGAHADLVAPELAYVAPTGGLNTVAADPVLRQNDRLEAFFNATRRLPLPELRNPDNLAALIGAIGLARDERDLYGADRRYMNRDQYGLAQIPLQLARFLIQASQLQIESFAEVGTFHGYTFATAAIYLSRFNRQFRAVTVEPIFDPAVAPWLRARLSVEFRKGTVDALEGETFDLALIDGHHDYRRVRYDFEQLSPRCRFCALHDINDAYVATSPDNDGGVPRFWQELKAAHPDAVMGEHLDHSQGRRIMGLGLLRM